MSASVTHTSARKATVNVAGRVGVSGVRSPAGEQRRDVDIFDPQVHVVGDPTVLEPDQPVAR
jgi:hypothetical protein